METPLSQAGSLIPIIEKVAEDKAKEIFRTMLRESQYSVANVPDHHHNGADSAVLGTEAMTAFSDLPANKGGVVNATTLGNQVVGQNELLVGYGNLNQGANQLTAGSFTTNPLPVIYGHGTGVDSAFNEGTAPYGTAIFFENGTSLSALYVNTRNGWRAMATSSLSAAQKQLSVATTTNGTNAVSVFATTPGVILTITAVYLIANDATAGNITVENPASTVVATIAKGTVAGAIVGATSLANTIVPSANNVIVKSSSAGNATVIINYSIA